MSQRLLMKAVLLGLPLLAGCADAGAGPASNRGFFGGLAAMATGNDERGAARLESTAGAQESAAQAAVTREASARQAANASSAEVAATQRRLAALQDRLRGQRATLARLRAEGSQSAERTAELARLQTQLDALEREQRGARRAGNPTSADLRRYENNLGDVDAALSRAGSI
jgi:hypothetical protein